MGSTPHAVPTRDALGGVLNLEQYGQAVSRMHNVYELLEGSVQLFYKLVCQLKNNFLLACFSTASSILVFNESNLTKKFNHYRIITLQHTNKLIGHWPTGKTETDREERVKEFVTYFLLIIYKKL